MIRRRTRGRDDPKVSCSSPAAPRGRRAIRATESGASLVEMAVVGVLFFTLVFAAFDFAIYVYSRETITNGVREAGRAAAVWSTATPTVNSCTTTPASISGASATDDSLICYVKQKVGLNSSNTRVNITWTNSGDVAGDHVRICAMTLTKGTTGFTTPFIPKRVTADVTVRLEQNFPDFNNVSETAISGDWSFCT